MPKRLLLLTLLSGCAHSPKPLICKVFEGESCFYDPSTNGLVCIKDTTWIWRTCENKSLPPKKGLDIH